MSDKVEAGTGIAVCPPWSVSSERSDHPCSKTRSALIFNNNVSVTYVLIANA